MGIGSHAYGGGSGTQYFVGHFDGHEFINDNSADCVLWMDFGRDYYAAQSFSGMNNGPPLVMAWLSNWDYAFSKPTREFRGALSLPRRIHLLETDSELRLIQQIPDNVACQFEMHPLVPGRIAPTSGTYLLSGTVSLEPGEILTLALFGESQTPLSIVRDATTGAQHLAIQRLAQLPGEQPLPSFASDYRLPINNAGPVKIDCFVDNGVIELSLNEGEQWATNLFFPEQVSGSVVVSRQSAEAGEFPLNHTVASKSK